MIISLEIMGIPNWWQIVQWIGLRGNLQESPIFNGKIYGFLYFFPTKPIQSLVWYFNLLPEWDQMGIAFVSLRCLRACCGKTRFVERVLSSAKGPFSIANFWITTRYRGYCLMIFSRCPTTCKICRLGRALQWHLGWSSLIYRYIGYFRYLYIK